jgi:hypothetical protein
LAEVLGCDRSTVSRYESAYVPLPEKQAKVIDRVWMTEGLFARLVRFARAGHDPDWWRNYVEYETKATQLKSYAALVVPGLLQIPEYIRALLIGGQVVEDVEAGVQARLSRQALLTRPRPVQLWATIKQSALEDPIGGPEVMRAQLAHLIEASQRPNIFLRIIEREVGAHIGVDGSFSIMTTATSTAAYMEAVGGGRLSLDPSEIARFTVRFDQIGADALTREATRGLLTQLMETMT